MAGRWNGRTQGLRLGGLAGIFSAMRFEKIWIEECRATRAIKRHFGARDALDSPGIKLDADFSKGCAAWIPCAS
jgi:hypothetical protein